ADIYYIKEAISFSRHFIVQCYFHGLMRRGRNFRKQTALHYLAVALYLVIARDGVLQRREVVIIGKTHLAFGGVYQLCAYGTDYIFVFQQARTYAAIRIHQAVHTEVTIVGKFAKVAAI